MLYQMGREMLCEKWFQAGPKNGTLACCARNKAGCLSAEIGVTRCYLPTTNLERCVTLDDVLCIIDETIIAGHVLPICRSPTKTNAKT